MDRRWTDRWTVPILLTSTRFTSEAIWVPGDVHGFDDSTNDEGLALGAARSKQHVEVRFAVLSTFKLVENTIFERLRVEWEKNQGMGEELGDGDISGEESGRGNN